MGMTDSQFKAFIRFVLDSLQEVKKEKDPAAGPDGHLYHQVKIAMGLKQEHRVQACSYND